MKFTKNTHYYFTVAVFLCLIYIACSSDSKIKSGTVIKGKFANAEHLPILVERLGPSGFVFVDSIITDEKGNFNAVINEPKTEFYRLKVSPKSFAVFVLDSTSTLNFEGDALNLNQTIKISGNRTNEAMVKVNRIASIFLSQNDSILQIWKNRSEDQNEVLLRNQLREAYKKVQDDLAKEMIRFIESNLDNFSAISAVEYLDPDNYLTYYEKVYESLKDKYAESQYFKGFASRFFESKRLGIGSPAPEIALRNPLGETKTLSSFRGKIVLVYFWASWCPPCRAESANLVRLYKKYKDKGFEIFSVSLDNDPNLWKKAIMQDGLTWTHVSDLSNWDSKVVPLYNLKSIPQTYLLDKEGKILAKSLTGEGLKRKLIEIFGE